MKRKHTPEGALQRLLCLIGEKERIELELERK